MKKLKLIIALLFITTSLFAQNKSGYTFPSLWKLGGTTIESVGGWALKFSTPFTLGSTSVTTTGTRFNYLSGVTGTTGTTTSNLVFSDSPTLSGTITFNGALSLPTTSKSANYTATSSDYSIFCTGGSSGIIITLPASASNSGRIYVIKKVDSGLGKITIDGNASETIDGELTWVLTLQFESITIQSNGSNWYII
jgi:hypothetical protein